MGSFFGCWVTLFTFTRLPNWREILPIIGILDLGSNGLRGSFSPADNTYICQGQGELELEIIILHDIDGLMKNQNTYVYRILWNRDVEKNKDEC
jgi:hypothetical protein